MSGAPEAPALPEKYSQAFEKMVKSDDDTVGLLAYALYKQMIREDAMQGNAGAGGSVRNPTPTMVSHYRSTAEQMLGQFANSAIESATPGIQQSALRSDLALAVTELKDHISERTRAFPAFGIALAAWVASLLITVIVLAAVDFGDLGGRIGHLLDQVTHFGNATKTAPD